MVLVKNNLMSLQFSHVSDSTNISVLLTQTDNENRVELENISIESEEDLTFINASFVDDVSVKKAKTNPKNK